MLNVTSCSRRISQIFSHDVFIGFSLWWTSIHFASSEPPRETRPMSRFFTSGRCDFKIPAWIVM